MPKLGGEIPAQFLGRVPEVTLVDDIVAIEHRPGLMPGDIHGDALGHAGAHQTDDPRLLVLINRSVTW